MKDKKIFRGPLLYIVLIIAIVLLVKLVGTPAKTDKDAKKGYSEFMEMVKDGDISAIQVTANTLTALKTDSAYKPSEMPDKYD